MHSDGGPCHCSLVSNQMNTVAKKVCNFLISWSLEGFGELCLLLFAELEGFCERNCIRVGLSDSGISSHTPLYGMGKGIQTHQSFVLGTKPLHEVKGPLQISTHGSMQCKTNGNGSEMG